MELRISLAELYKLPEAPFGNLKEDPENIYSLWNSDLIIPFLGLSSKEMDGQGLKHKYESHNLS